MAPLAAALVALALAQPEPGAAPPPPPPPPPVVPVPPVQAEPRTPVPSLVSAEPLRGTSLLTVSVGWPRVRVAYAQGLGRATDLGGFGDFDWTTTELRAGLAWRGKVIPRAPPFDGALRLWMAWYQDGGGRWLYHHNHPDQGVELGAGVSYSRQGAGGVVSLFADAPLTITFRKTGGAFLSPKAAFAYETPLYGPFTVGLQLGMGVRGGIGYAPLKQGYGELTLLILASSRL